MQPRTLSASTGVKSAYQGQTIHVELVLLHGAEIGSVAQELCELLEVYREWPYLYEQSYPRENSDYLEERYVQQPGSVICLAYIEGKIVGAAMGVPLNCAPNYYQAAFPAQERRPDTFYLGEMVVLPEYRYKKIATQLYQHLLESISGSYRALCFATVVRSENDRLLHFKPRGYTSLDLAELGFEKRDDLHTTAKWKVIGETEESEHPMIFWWKGL